MSAKTKDEILLITFYVQLAILLTLIAYVQLRIHTHREPSMQKQLFDSLKSDQSLKSSQITSTADLNASQSLPLLNGMISAGAHGEQNRSEGLGASSSFASSHSAAAKQLKGSVTSGSDFIRQ